MTDGGKITQDGKMKPAIVGMATFVERMAHGFQVAKSVTPWLRPSLNSPETPAIIGALDKAIK